MLAILAFFLVVLAAGLGFAWLADHPGTVSLIWQGQEVGTSFTVFVVLQIALVVAAILLFWLVRGFFKAPDRLSRFFSTRRRDKGYRALSTGIIAVGAGDAVTARRMTKQAAKLLPGRSEPMVRFLDAQTALIEGDNARARAIFEELEAQPDTRLVGLRGLYLEAERLGDRGAARNYAERAARIAPHVGWAGGAVLDLKAAQGDYEGALTILEAQRDSRLIDKVESRRLRAVLLTGRAMGMADAHPAGARTLAREAQKLAPDLVPAALIAGRASIRLDDWKTATKALEASWKVEPHPEVASLYVHARSFDGVEERLKRARTLAALHPGHVESRLVVAQAAFDARDYATARAEATAAVELSPRESTYLLLADIEDAESGNEALVRQWMSRALHAPKDPAWTADGVTSREWAPVSPVTGRLDAFRWVAPTAPPQVRNLSEPGSRRVLAESQPAREADSPAAPEATPPVREEQTPAPTAY